MQENRMFAEMGKVARQWLADRDPVKIAENAHISFDGRAFFLTSLGQTIKVSWPDCQITPQVHPWYQLMILHYLHLADGTPLTGQTVTFAQQKDGLVRGGGFDRKAEQCIRRSIGKTPPEVLKKRCEALGGVPVKSTADYCVQLPLLPMYPVTLNLWFADEEFPPSGRLLLDSSAEHYLTVEDSVMAGEMILEILKGDHNEVFCF